MLAELVAPVLQPVPPLVEDVPLGLRTNLCELGCEHLVLQGKQPLALLGLLVPNSCLLLESTRREQDVQEDKKAGHQTLFSQTTGRWPLDPLMNRLFHFLDQMLTTADCLPPRGQEAARDLIQRNCTFSIMQAVAEHPSFVSKPYYRALSSARPCASAIFAASGESSKSGVVGSKSVCPKAASWRPAGSRPETRYSGFSATAHRTASTKACWKISRSQTSSRCPIAL